jgi:Mn2+/Fe2+ NRAMP family transporter
VAQESITIADPPKSFKEKLKWLGPGFLWMVSAAGSGELLFTPRVGALYGYTLIWAMIAAVILKWFINREIGRYTVCTGKTIIDGFGQLPGPKNWAIYLILIPQLLVAVATIAGLAGSSATALVLVLPGDIRLWTVLAILASTALVIWGRFKAVEKVATVLAIALGVAAIIAALTVFPDASAFAAGFIPKMPADVKYDEVFPWLGFMLSGAAGMIWYSYWIQAKGYGAKKNEGNHEPLTLNKNQTEKLRKWLSQMTADSTVAVGGTLIITLSFLILGTELLKPNGLIPEENKVAEVLGQMLGQLWGPIGFWFMITAVFVGFWDTVLSDQDGFGRMFSGGTRLLLKNMNVRRKWLTEKNLRRAYVIGLVTVAPIILYLLLGEPVSLLKIAGAIEAAHIPVVVVLILYLNTKRLPDALKPSKFTFTATAMAGIFFLAFSVIYVLQISGVLAL